jgi:hypothetical protein
MEKALAAIHQSGLHHEPLTLIYGEVTGQVGLMIRCSASQREFVVGPIEANYPQCSVAEVAESPHPPSGWHTWSVSLNLSPEIYPILRHAQFEDLLKRRTAWACSKTTRSRDLPIPRIRPLYLTFRMAASQSPPSGQT